MKYDYIQKEPNYKIALERVRTKNKLSKKKLSLLSGVSRSYITEIESGKYDNPTVITLIKLSKALECKIEDLIEIQ